MKLQGLHFADVVVIQETVTDKLKEVQKEEFLADFQKVHDHTKLVYMWMGLILNKKKMSSIFKKQSPKTFGQRCL